MEFQEAFTSSSTSTTTTHHQHHEILHIESSLTTSNTTSDSDCRVVFADPCSQCGTKKRRLCPYHQHFNFKPRKKLVTSQPYPLFQTSSVCQLTFPTLSPEKKQFLGRPSGVNASPPPALRPPRPPPSKDHTPTSSSGKCKKTVRFLTDQKESPEKCDYSPEKSPEFASKEVLASCSGSPGSGSSRKSPLKHRTSSPTWSPIRTIGSRCGGDRSPASDSETKSVGSSPDKEKWKGMKEIFGVMNKLLASGMFNTQQKEKPQETNNQQKKGSMEFSDSDNIMKGDRGVYKGSAQCSCGKKYQMILSILPE